MTQTVYIDNDNRIKLVGLVDADGAYQNSAVVAVTLKDDAGVDIPGEAWPLAMPYVTASNGDYRAILQNTLTITDNQPVTAIVDVESGGLTARFKVALTAKARTIEN